jgi:cell division septum initiation protein DivIVA
MNNNDLINEYINQLANAYKQATVDNIMLKTQITLLTKQIEEMKQKTESSYTENNEFTN